MPRLAITSPVLRRRYAAKEEGQSGSDHSGDALLRPGHVIAAKVTLTLGWFVPHRVPWRRSANQEHNTDAETRLLHSTSQESEQSMQTPLPPFASVEESEEF